MSKILIIIGAINWVYGVFNHNDSIFLSGVIMIVGGVVIKELKDKQ